MHTLGRLFVFMTFCQTIDDAIHQMSIGKIFYLFIHSFKLLLIWVQFNFHLLVLIIEAKAVKKRSVRIDHACTYPLLIRFIQLQVTLQRWEEGTHTTTQQHSERKKRGEREKKKKQSTDSFTRNELVVSAWKNTHTTWKKKLVLFGTKRKKINVRCGSFIISFFKDCF